MVELASLNVSSVCESSAAAFGAVHGSVERHRLLQRDDLREQLVEVGRVRLGQRRDQTGEARLPAGVVEDLGALRVGLERA